MLNHQGADGFGIKSHVATLVESYFTNWQEFHINITEFPYYLTQITHEGEVNCLWETSALWKPVLPLLWEHVPPGFATENYVSNGLFFFPLTKHCYHGLCIQLQY